MKLKKIVLILCTIIFLPVLIWKLNVFSITKIDTKSNAECVSEQDLAQELGSLSINWLDLNSTRIKDKLTTKFLCIKDVNISYNFPRGIKIEVFGRKFLTKVVSFDQTSAFSNFESSPSSEAALIDWSFPAISSDDAFVADNSGFIFIKKPSNFPLPTFFLAENLSLGKQLDFKIFTTLDLVFSKCLQMGIFMDPLNFKAKKYGNILLLDSFPKVALSLERDILKQLASLQLILQKAKIDEKTVVIIDLRFDKPVVEYLPKMSK